MKEHGAHTDESRSHVVTAKQRGLMSPAMLAELGANTGGLAAHLADTSVAHAASAVGFTPAAGIAATDVQAAIVEDAGDLAAHLAASGAVLTASDSANTARAATTNIDLLTLDLTVGVWYVTGKCNVLFGATPGQVDLRLLSLGVGVSTLGLAATAQGTIHTPPAIVVVASGTTTVTLRGYGSQAWTSQGTGGAGGNGNLITIYAVRVG